MRSLPPLSARQCQSKHTLALLLLMSGNHPEASHKPLQGCQHAHESGRPEDRREPKEMVTWSHLKTNCNIFVQRKKKEGSFLNTTQVDPCQEPKKNPNFSAAARQRHICYSVVSGRRPHFMESRKHPSI